MTSKKMAIMNSLENLSTANLSKFCSALVDRGGEQEVPLNKVENKDITIITNVLVSTFTEDGAPAVVIELLNDIQCRNEAKKLNDKIAKLKSSAAKKEHFVDKHMLELIKRVCNIKPILDVLQKKKVIQSEIYEEINQTPSNQEKIRKIYKLALKSGKAAKDIFYECLLEYEPYLMADLEHS
ncbi:apoptosis-associated speck-like protein containing a CARD [Vanacampus margaritifer]